MPEISKIVEIAKLKTDHSITFDPPIVFLRVSCLSAFVVNSVHYK
jgi:hypothetical protein